jgi:hypothetical protein
MSSSNGDLRSGQHSYPSASKEWRECTAAAQVKSWLGTWPEKTTSGVWGHKIKMAAIGENEKVNAIRRDEFS